MAATIFIVDDDQNIRELLSVNLIAAGYTVIEASNGKEAMGKIRERVPELIILDIMMPEIDGWEFCKFVRDDPQLENIKIIIQIPHAHELMRTNKHKPGNMAVIVNAPKLGLRSFEDAVEAGNGG